MNTYSSKDGATWPRAKSYLASRGETIHDYDVRVVQIINRWDDVLYYLGMFSGFIQAIYFTKMGYERVLGDHGFQNNTYQQALTENIKEFRLRGSVYNGN